MMQRREFLATVAGGVVASALPRTTSLARPATLDLRTPLRLAVSCIYNRMDPTHGTDPGFPWM